MLSIDYRESDRRAVLSWDDADEQERWLLLIRRLVTDHTDEAVFETAHRLTLPWWNLVALRPGLLNVFSAFELRPQRDIGVTPTAAHLLGRAAANTHSYSTATSAVPLPEHEIRSELKALGFERQLSNEQARNLSRIAVLAAAATFSVPGAGKTTEALAFYTLRARHGERLLVVAPKNAFAAWDEQLGLCLQNESSRFVRLRGGRERIARLLDDDPKLMLITYQQLTRVADLIAARCAERPTVVFLDESHRIKSGIDKQTARAALSIAHLPTSKMIMSGTPMPQATDDLIPQFAFLYPEIPADADNVVELMRPVFVRTTKAQLRLPPVHRVAVPLQMAPLQGRVYELMKSEIAREAASTLSSRSRQSFRRLGRSVARVLQFVSNPSLLSADFGGVKPELMAAVLQEGEGPKLKYVIKRARELSREGKKVLIWSSFVRNVEYIARRLADLGAVYIHGGVDAGDEDDDETREGKIKLFHDSTRVSVLVANPAAASEGISLHKVCHNAIYLDRTFNAAHYLQSEDRIHRFGLLEDQETKIEIVECVGTIDQTVRQRLDFKIGLMAAALDDPSLRPDPIALDPVDIEDYDEYSTGLAREDIEALVRDLK